MTALVLRLLSVVALILADSGATPPPSSGQAVEPAHAARPLFETSDRCLACHVGVSTVAGEDVSIGFDWRASMMANAARDPYWQAAVRREVMDHPTARSEIEDKCATCHMPMARYEAHLGGARGTVFDNLPVGVAEGRSADLAADGVSCTACHQISPEGLGEPASFTGGFSVDEATPWGERSMWGPFTTDEGRAAIMRSATGFTPREAPHVQSSELCASCHTLYTHALDDQGREAGELPEQVPYLEWRSSAFAAEGRSCQSCHMPVVDDAVPVTGVLGQPRTDVSRHVFRGGNFFVLGMLNRYRDELGVTAMPQELDAAVRRTVEHLQTATASIRLVDVRFEDGVLLADVIVENLAGHKLPTAYPSRRAWIHFTVRDASGRIVFQSGGFEPSGAVRGNAHDEDGSTHEPHYTVIERPDQVQIYESVMVDSRGRITTGLMSGVRYVKDNRLLPRGLTAARAEPDIAVHGAASQDPDFGDGRDGVRYRVPLTQVSGPFTVQAELWYQPIGYRWARTLADYDSFETERFTRYYDAMSKASAIPLARALATAG